MFVQSCYTCWHTWWATPSIIEHIAVETFWKTAVYKHCTRIWQETIEIHSNSMLQSLPIHVKSSIIKGSWFFWSEEVIGMMESKNLDACFDSFKAVNSIWMNICISTIIVSEIVEIMEIVFKGKLFFIRKIWFCEMFFFFFFDIISLNLQ